MTFCTVFDLQL